MSFPGRGILEVGGLQMRLDSRALRDIFVARVTCRAITALQGQNLCPPPAEHCDPVDSGIVCVILE